MERPTEYRTQASESRKQQDHHLQGKPYIFILQLYFIFKCVHKHAEVTTQVNSATRKLQCRTEGVGMELLFSWPSVQAQLTPKVHPQEAGQTTLVANKNTCVWNTIGGMEPFQNDSYGDEVALDTLSKIPKGTMNIQRKLRAIMGKVACWDTVQ